jgi:hypothetical protein
MNTAGALRKLHLLVQLRREVAAPPAYELWVRTGSVGGG